MLHVPEHIQSVWEKFDKFPMETLTKIWVHLQEGGGRQREVTEMREHREQYGIAGNCFDLSLWLLDEFKQAGIPAYPIGHHLGSEHAHIAVIALDDKGGRYLCDLGDQWLNPLPIDAVYDGRRLKGHFPAAEIQFEQRGEELEVQYYRPNGKASKQTFELKPIEINKCLQAADQSQRLIKPQPLFECRIPYNQDKAHWEFYNWESFLSTWEGLIDEPVSKDIDQWVEKLYYYSGYDKGMLQTSLKAYDKLTEN
ncbi:hypothetical protein [Oceanobacillus manasiensis]|uniref:hypothetical protein n=1 Tax=Oceanobacillus manasiensis TaxID=586413 RepID=UPI0005A64D1B|nr:hypothetical protein [Oceanobacillus manasiensis]